MPFPPKVSKGSVFDGAGAAALHKGTIVGVQPSRRDSMNREIFAMLDDIRIANKEYPLSKSSKMAAMT